MLFLPKIFTADMGTNTKLIAAAIGMLLTAMPTESSGQTKNRYDALPVHHGCIIFAGDSITDDCEWNELFSNQSVLNRGIDGNTSTYLLQRVHELTRHTPDKIFIAIGTNDLPHTPIDRVIENIDRIIETFASESPGTRIYIQSVLPTGPRPMFRDADSDRKNALIRELNASYRQLCKEKGLTFIDLYDSFIDPDGRYIRKELTSDDLHLTGKGYLVWKSIVEPYIR